MLCEYGCNQEAKFQLKNGRMCCSEYYQSCPELKKKFSKHSEKRYAFCEKCQKQIIKASFKIHSKQCVGKKYCLECGKEIPAKNKFCNNSCSASYSNKNKIKLYSLCLNCGIKIYGKKRKYCSIECKRKSLPFNRKSFKEKKLIIWEEQGRKCNECNFNLYDIEIGPYELHHIDGDRQNNLRDNLEVLCCNCHSMTPTDRFKGRKHTKETKQLISKRSIDSHKKRKYCEIE